MPSNRVAPYGPALLLGLVSALRPALAAPPPIIDLEGRGVQIYACTAPPEGFAWRLKAPEATLTDQRGRVFGRHFAGPSWQASDGSIVVGEAVASAGGAARAVPWLLLRAKSHAGQGIFASCRSRAFSRAAARPAARRRMPGATAAMPAGRFVWITAPNTCFSPRPAPNPRVARLNLDAASPFVARALSESAAAFWRDTG